MSQTDSNSQESDFQDDVSAISAHVSESSIDNETEEEMDPWIPLIEEAKQRSNIAFEEMKESLINSGLDEQSAKDKAYSNILPKLQKELENIYMERLVWMRQLKKDPVHKKIMRTKDELVENDDFDPESSYLQQLWYYFPSYVYPSVFNLALWEEPDFRQSDDRLFSHEYA